MSEPQRGMEPFSFGRITLGCYSLTTLAVSYKLLNLIWYSLWHKLFERFCCYCYCSVASILYRRSQTTATSDRFSGQFLRLRWIQVNNRNTHIWTLTADTMLARSKVQRLWSYDLMALYKYAYYYNYYYKV